MRILHKIANLIYPEDITCIVCGEELDIATRYCICKKCEINRLDNYCLQCGCKITGTKKYCDNCLSSGRQFDVARAPFCFEENNARRLVYALKYGDKTYLGKYLAEFMADVFYKQDWSPDIITYIPLHKRKQIFVRGYNQSELIAKALSEIIDVPMAPLLKKTSYSNKNASLLGREDRKKLLKDTFTVTEDVKGKRILLVDDVLTTGSTTEECARVLKLAKAKNVWVLTFATSSEHLKLFDPKDDNEKLQKMISGKKL